MRSGTDLRDSVAAAALANARTFGGEDYVGFHTMMALAPAYHMARSCRRRVGRCPCSRFFIAMPVVSRNMAARPRVLHPVDPAKLPPDTP